MTMHPPVTDYNDCIQETRYAISLPTSQMKLLKAIMQNPLHENEPREVAALREAIFEAIQL